MKIGGSYIQHVYLAGKIGEWHDNWRSVLVPKLYTVDPDSYEGSNWPVLVDGIVGFFDYTGPYFIDPFDYTKRESAYGPAQHGLAASSDSKPHNWQGPREQVVQCCQAAIARSDLIYAWIENPDCYGTLAEIGYAAALGKIIWIAFSDKLKYHTDKSSGPPTGEELVEEMWFISTMASQMAISPSGHAGFFECLTQAKAQDRWRDG